MAQIKDTLNFEGGAQLSRALIALGKSSGGKALRSAAVGAMLPALRKAQSNAPKGTRAHKTYKGRLVAPGFTSRNIKRKSRMSRDKQKVFVRLGVAQEAFYAVNFNELGVASRGIPGKPWLRPAFDSTYREVQKLLGEKLLKNIIKIAKKRGSI